jgi:hypothetical protein
VDGATATQVWLVSLYSSTTVCTGYVYFDSMRKLSPDSRDKLPRYGSHCICLASLTK